MLMPDCRFIREYAYAADENGKEYSNCGVHPCLIVILLLIMKYATRIWLLYRITNHGVLKLPVEGRLDSNISTRRLGSYLILIV